MRLLAITAGLCGLMLAACATASGPTTDSDPPAVAESGPLRVTLLGNYVGKQLRIAVDDRVIVDGRLTFPPMGAEHRYDLDWGAARTARVQVDIEDCEGSWTGQLQLVPSATAYLLIQGCQVEALAPG